MIWLLACTTPESDQDRYLTASRVDRAEATAICMAITESTLRADCLIHTANRFAQAGDITTAQATCQTIDDALWRDECWFLTADSAHILGEAALRACQKSGRFRPHCQGHALGRAVEALELPVGGEAESAREIGALVAYYRPKSTGQKKRTIVNELLAARVGDRWDTTPFDPALCGALTPAMCAWAYRASLDDTAAAPGTLCPGPVTAEAVTTIGLSGWTEAGAGVAEGVWRGICAQVEAGLPVDLRPARLPRDLMPVE